MVKATVKKLSKIQQRLAGNIIPPRRSVFAQPAAVVSQSVKQEDAISGPKKRVIFMSREVVKSYRFDPAKDVLISISDTDARLPYLSQQPLETLALFFHDDPSVQEEREGHRWIMAEDGEKIVNFVLKHEDCNNIIVHCNYGQSRSKAAAIAISNMTGRSILHSDDYGRIAQYKESANSHYNRRVYEMILSEYECCQDN